MQQSATASGKPSTNAQTVNMTTLMRQPLRVQSTDSIQLAGATTQLANGNLVSLQSPGVQSGSNGLLTNESGQQNNQSRVTTLILPSRSAANAQFGQRSVGTMAAQKQNLVTITRMQSTPTTPTGATTQILYNTNLGTLNFAPAGYVHNGAQTLQTAVPLGNVNVLPASIGDVNSQQFVVASPCRRLANRQCLYNQPFAGQFANQQMASFDGQQLQFVQPRITQFQFAQPSAFSQFSLSQCPPPHSNQGQLVQNVAVQPTQPPSSPQSHSTCEKQEPLCAEDADYKVETIKEECKPTPPPNNSVPETKVRGHQDDGLTNLNWLQDPNLFRLPTLRIGPAATPPPCAPGPASPAAAHGPQLLRFASQQTVSLARFGEDPESDTEALVRVAGEVEYRDARPASAELASFDHTVFAAPDTTFVSRNAPATSAPRPARQRSAPYGAPRRPSRRAVGQPRTRATRKSQQNAAPPTINPRFAYASGAFRSLPQQAAQRTPFVTAFNHDPLLSADARSTLHPFTFAARRNDMPFPGAEHLENDAMGDGQTDIGNAINEEFEDILRAFENDENNMDLADDSEGIASPGLDLTVHGVALKGADLIGLAAGDSFDRLFGFSTLNGSANSGSASASQPSSSNGRSTLGGAQSPFGPFGSPGTAFGPPLPLRGNLNASLNTPSGPLSLSNSLNVAGPFLGASLSASAAHNMVIDLMNPNELCFNDERGNEQNDSDLLESLGDFALDSILGKDS